LYAQWKITYRGLIKIDHMLKAHIPYQKDAEDANVVAERIDKGIRTRFFEKCRRETRLDYNDFNQVPNTALVAFKTDFESVLEFIGSNTKDFEFVKKVYDRVCTAVSQMDEAAGIQQAKSIIFKLRHIFNSPYVIYFYSSWLKVGLSTSVTSKCKNRHKVESSPEV
jgi:hypothetical protein